jgi:hypothetical protein
VELIIVGVIVLAAVSAVLFPLLRRRPADVLPAQPAALEDRIASYRAALLAGTVCDRCLRDNPEGSRYCADCGRELDVATADNPAS